MRFALCVVVFLGCGTASDDADEPASSTCERVLAHIVDLRVASATGTPTQLTDLRTSLQRAMGAEFVESCEKSLTAEQQQCSLAAPDITAVAACATTSR